MYLTVSGGKYIESEPIFHIGTGLGDQAGVWAISSACFPAAEGVEYGRLERKSPHAPPVVTHIAHAAPCGYDARPTYPRQRLTP